MINAPTDKIVSIGLMSGISKDLITANFDQAAIAENTGR